MNKNTINWFPKWNPHRETLRVINSDYCKKTIYTALRNSSSGFIQRLDVRNIILKESDYKCVYCGSKEKLTIDHVVFVYQCANGDFPIEKLNIRENLQTLCMNCNFKKIA